MSPHTPDDAKMPLCESCGERPQNPVPIKWQTGEDVDFFCEECRDYEREIEEMDAQLAWDNRHGGIHKHPKLKTLERLDRMRTRMTCELK